MTCSHTVNLARPLIRTKEKELLLLDRPAKRKTKLVLLEDGARLAGSVQKEIVGVKNLISQELENRPMEGIAARFCNQADIGAAITPVASIVLVLSGP